MVALALIALGVAQNPSDSYGRFVERLTHAQTLSGTLVWTDRKSGKPSVYEEEFWLKRPNFCCLEYNDGAKLSSLWVGDGKDAWYWHPEERRLDKVANYVGFGTGLTLMESFLGVTDPTWIETPEPPTQEAFGGKQLIRFHLKLSSDNSPMVLDMDPKTDLPVRYAIAKTVSGPPPTLKFLEFRDLKFDPPIDPARFKYEPEVKPNSWNPLDYMLKSGAKVPDFSGKLMSSHERFHLAKALSGHKAILLDLVMIGCLPCWVDLKNDLADLNRRYGSKGLEVVAVGLGSEKEINEALDGVNLHLPVVIGDTCQIDMFSTFRVGISATEYLIDSNGTIRARYSGGEVPAIEHDLARLGIGN